jgi:hypothetical protein
MYRKKRRASEAVLDLDSLMDILSCLVGVMLFLVIYTVLEMTAASFQLTVSVPFDRPMPSRRLLVVANEGSVRVMDHTRPVSDLMAGMSLVPFEETAEYVAQINVSPPTDAHFRYRLEYDEETALLLGRDVAFAFTVDELPGEAGDPLLGPAEASEFLAHLEEYDPEQVWLEFGVDGQSLDVFRRARRLAEERGFDTRWGPLRLEFPVRFALNDETDGPGPRNLLSKPRR